MLADLASMIDVWEECVEFLPGYEEEIEAVSALVIRDGIAQALSDGMLVSSRERERLAAADERYLMARSSIAERLPGVFTGRAPRELWWWYMDALPPADRPAGMAATV